MHSFTYESMTVPVEYLCSRCKVVELKLWRQYNTFTNYLELSCAKCANPSLKVDIDGKHKGKYGNTDQIEDVTGKTGTLVPAVPTIEGDTFWGYTSVPLAGCAWWRALPTYQGQIKRPFYISPEEAAEEKRFNDQREEAKRRSLENRMNWRKQTVYCVEASDYEHHMLWCQHASEASIHSYISRPRLSLMGMPSASSFSEDELFDKKLFALAENRLHREQKVDQWLVEWEEMREGEMATIGELDNRPIAVSIRWARINGKIVMFYWPTSQLVDWKMVEEWRGKEYKHCRNQCDANNFHNCLAMLRKDHD